MSGADSRGLLSLQRVQRRHARRNAGDRRFDRAPHDLELTVDAYRALHAELILSSWTYTS